MRDLNKLRGGGMRQRTEEEELGMAGWERAFTRSTEGPRESRRLVSGQGGLTEFLKRKGQVWAVGKKELSAGFLEAVNDGDQVRSQGKGPGRGHTC